MEYFFFTPRDRKYQNGKRPSRGTGNGYWRPTGADIPIWHNGAEIGSKKVLVYFAGKPPNGTKTNWIMHKFTTNNSEPRVRSNPDDMRLDDWVLCKIYERVGKANGRVEEEDNEAEHVQMDVEAATDTFAYDTMKDINKNFGYANDELMELDLAAILDWDFSGTITELLADDDHDPQPNEAIAAAPITISAAHADNIVNQTFVPSDHHQQPLGSRDQIFVPSNDQSFVPSNEHQEPIERSYDQIGMPPYDNHQQKPLGSYDQIFVPSGCHLQQPHCSHDQILVPAFSDQQPPLSSYEQIFVPLDHHQQKQLGSYDGNFVPSNYHQQPTRFCDQISAPFVDQTIVLSNDHQQQPFGSYDQIFVSSSDHKQPPLGSCDQMSIPTDDHQRDSGTYGQFFVPYDDQQLFAVADKVPISKNSAGGYCYVTESFGHCEGIVLEPMGMMSSGSYSTVISMQKQKLQQEIYDIERVEKQLDQSHFGDPLVAYYLDTSSFKFQFGNV